MNRTRVASALAVAALLVVVAFATFPSKGEPPADVGMSPGAPPTTSPVPAEGDTAPDLGDIVEEDSGIVVDRPDITVDVPGDAEGVDENDLVGRPDPFAAIEYARTYYTIGAATPMADHRASLRPFATDAHLEAVTNDDLGLFGDSDAVRLAFTENSVAQVRQHQVVSRGTDRADIAVVVDVLVTSQGMERSDSHLMLLTVLQPAVDGGRWLVDAVVIDPEDNGHGESFEFPDDNGEPTLPGAGEA